MKRVLIDARESGTTTGRYVDKLVEYLHKLKPEFEIVILTKTPRLEFFKKIAPDFKTEASDIKEFTFSEQYGLVWQLYGMRVDLVHFGMTHQPVLYFGKTVTTIHDLTTMRFRNPAKNPVIFGIKRVVYKWVIKRVARKAAYIITPSEFAKHDVAQYTKISPDKIVVTHLAADKISEPAKPLAGLGGQKFIMYVGRPQPHKNLQRLIEAFVVIKRSHPELKLVLAGKKDVLFERIEKKVLKQGISDVVFTGFVSEGQLRWLYEHTEAYVFPSLSEGFGLPGLEAMVHGAPVVSSNATCLPEVYGQAAHYFNPKDVTEMAAKISEVLDNAKLQTKLVAAGKTQAAKYSWEKLAKQTLDVYRKSLS